MFKSVVREANLTERTETQIENLILGGTLRPGERLPSERELGEKLGVSKTVVREALRSLAAKGLVEVRVGSGTYVLHIGSQMMSGPIARLMRSSVFGPEQIHEVREALEVRIAALASERATPEQLERMERAIAALQKRKLSALEFAQADVEFHSALAVAANNPLLAALIDSINDVMIEVRLRAYHRDGLEIVVPRALDYHGRILERVKARDVPGAARAMQEHLSEALDTLRRSERS